MHEIADTWAAGGRTILRLMATPATSSLPFGAVAHLLGEQPLADRAVLLRQLQQTIALTEPEPPMVLVDDIDLLDDASLALVTGLAANRSTTVLATMRTEVSSKSTMVPLWKDESFERLDIAPLDRQGSDAATTAMLGAPASVGLATRLWGISQGNPLYLRELIFASLDVGTITQGSKYFDLQGDIVPSERVHDIVRHRIADLDGAGRRVLNAVALAEPLPVAPLLAIAEQPVITALERQQLVVAVDGGGTQSVRVAHPIIAEVVRAELGGLERRELLATLAEVVAGTTSGQTDPATALALGTWLSDLGEAPPASIATIGAAEALRRFDGPLAERLARAAVDDDPSAIGLAILGSSLTAQHRNDEAAPILREAVALADSDDEITMAAGALVRCLLFGLGDIVATTAELDHAIARVNSPASVAELQAHAMLAAGMSGDFERALNLGADLTRTELPDLAAASTLMAYTLAQAMTGEVDGILDNLDRGALLAEDIRLQNPLLTEQIALNRVLGLVALARPADAVDLADSVISADDHDERLLAQWLQIGGSAHLMTGELDRAGANVAEAIEQQGRFDPLGNRVLVISYAAAVEAARGEVSAAMARIDQAKADPRHAEVRCLGWLGQAEAWVHAHTGDTAAGAAVAREYGDVVVEGWHHVWGAQTLHTAVRVGHPELVDDQLSALRERSSGPLVDLFARHCSAAAQRDVLQLWKVADEFVDIGAYLVAIDAFAWAASVGDDVELGARAALVAHTLAQRCRSYQPVLLAEVACPLSDRQLEIALLAGRGTATRQISEQLHLATKTVDNHLQRIYATLGINSRNELGHLLR